jgi:hypothetical protein
MSTIADQIKPLSRREIGEWIARDFEARAVAALAANNERLAERYEADARLIRQFYGCDDDR